MSSEVVAGGKNVYGVALGVLMLQSRFPRIPGDVGNASTWPFPVRYLVVDGAIPDRVVRSRNDRQLLELFVRASQQLESEGAPLITTNCGFLIRFQDELQGRLGVPFISSSLLQVPWLEALMPPGRRVGVITIERGSLTEEHFASAHLPVDLPIVGMEEVGGYFVDAILGDRDRIDVSRARDEHVAAARLLVERSPNVGAVVLECTNMPPYATVIQEAVKLPVHDLTTFISVFVEANRRRRFSGWL